jgi:predicted RNA-binding protein
MCLAKAYVRTDAVEELVMENVAHVVVNDGRVLLTSIFTETEELQGHITSVDFAKAKLVLQSP